MEPQFVFSHLPCPPHKKPGATDIYDPTRLKFVPVAKDAYFESLTDLNSIVLKYSVRASCQGRLLKPTGPCLPVSSPVKIESHQDLCSAVIPFSTFSQEWLRQKAAHSRRPQKRANEEPSVSESPRKKGAARSKARTRRKEGAIDEELETAEREAFGAETGGDVSSIARSQGKRTKIPILHNEKIPSSNALDFGEVRYLPRGNRFLPLANNRLHLEKLSNSAIELTGFKELSLLNSTVNWRYSGGVVSSFSVDGDEVGVIYPDGISSNLRLSRISLNSDSPRKTEVMQQTTKKGQEDFSIVYKSDLQSPIYQTECQKLEDSLPYVFIRTPRHCRVSSVSFDGLPDAISLTELRKFQSNAGDYFTHLSASPYIESEFLSASEKGVVQLWNAEQSKPRAKFDVPKSAFRKEPSHNWTGCYFGDSLASICIATMSGVIILDSRIRAKDKPALLLLEKREHTKGVEHDIVAGRIFPGNPNYHAVLTTDEVLIIDQRFPVVTNGDKFGTQPLRYPSKALTSNLYLKLTRDAATSCDIVLTGSQLSQSVMCHQVDMSNPARPATMASLPFFTASPKDLVPLMIDSDVSVPISLRSRFSRPMIGLEGFAHPQGGFSVVSATAFGDLFMQTFESVESDGYPSDGVKSFSVSDYGYKMDSEETCSMQDWLKKAAKAMPFQGEFFTPYFGNSVTEGRVAKKFADVMKKCVKIAPHPNCTLCTSSKGSASTGTGRIPEAVCPKCRLSLNSPGLGRVTSEEDSDEQSDVVKHDVTLENDVGVASLLPANLVDDFKALFAESATRNRIMRTVTRSLDAVDIPEDGLVPKGTDLHQRKRRNRKKQVQDQLDRTEALLLEVEPAQQEADHYDQQMAEDTANVSMNVQVDDNAEDRPQPVSENWNVDEDRDVGSVMDVEEPPNDFRAMLPLATSTQQMDDSAAPEPVRKTAPKKAVKGKRKTGF